MEQKSPKRFTISINMGISSAFVILIIVTTISLCGFIFITLRGFLREDLRKQLYNTVSVGALFIDGDAHEMLVSPDQESGERYLAIKKALRNIRDNTIDIRYVYTMRKNADGAFVFVVDAEDTDEMSHIGDVYDSPTAEMEKLYAERTVPIVETDFTKDQWGTWLSGFAPIRTSSGAFVGILGIDMSAEKIVENELVSFLVLAGIAAAVTLLVIVFGIIISRRITTPLRALEADMAKITKFEIEEDTVIPSMFKEIRSMNGAITNMKGSLRSFKKYVPADLVAQLITMNKEARLGGERKVLSMFFSDIEGSTTLGEKLTPETLVQTMAGYFSGMTGTVHRNRGTVDKYIGDCVMAFWNAPTDSPDHAYLACRTAVECQAFQREFNRELVAKGLPAINTRIGVNTGEVVVGNIGYEERLNYTVLGDHVNLASRLEGINKYYHTRVIISHNTWSLVRDRVVARIVDNVVVKGKSADVRIYELLALSDAASADERALAETTNRAFMLYMERKWDEALRIYRELLAANPNDGPAAVFVERIGKFKTAPPPADWKGSIVLRDK